MVQACCIAYSIITARWFHLALANVPNGVLVSNARGKAVAYSLCPLQERGKLLVGNNDEVYEGQIVGIHSRDNDLVG